MAGGGVFLDYWSYAKAQGATYDPFGHYAIPRSELVACWKAQGIDIRCEIQGGDILLIRRG
jgi:hypothetical protein